MCDSGFLATYAISYYELGRAAGQQAYDILVNGADPAATPVQTFDNGIATINTETCAALNLDLAALKEAFAPYTTEIIEITTAENF